MAFKGYVFSITSLFSITSIFFLKSFSQKTFIFVVQDIFMFPYYSLLFTSSGTPEWIDHLSIHIVSFSKQCLTRAWIICMSMLITYTLFWAILHSTMLKSSQFIHFIFFVIVYQTISIYHALFMSKHIRFFNDHLYSEKYL